MNKTSKIVLCLLLILFLALTLSAFAAALNTLSITLTRQAVHPGEEVTINFDFGQALGAYTFEIDFDDDLFEYVSNSGGTASVSGDTVTVVFYDASNPATVMSVTFRAKSNITTSNPTQFMITANGLANPDASVIFDNITVPIVRDVLVEPAYVNYTIAIEHEGRLEREIENPINVRITSPMGRYYDHLRLVAEVTTPNDATFRLLGTDSADLEHDVILSGWGEPAGFGLGGNVNVLYQFRGIFSENGEYALTLNLIDRDNSDAVIATTTRTLTVGEV
ncbi:MAG: hypothetical protein FWC68_03615, partial [Oscillospiraceae bacterium]|nr:hypothetical protein [Oscillospiraceae bacterium]